MVLRTLGGLTLEGSTLGRPKPLLLLAYLALEGAQDRKHLSELFWPEAANPMLSLRTALTQLRQSAPGAFEGESRLRATVACDARRFLEALEKGELERLQELYTGAFLKGFFLRELSAELEEWVYGTRESLAAQYREGLLKLAEGMESSHALEVAKLAEEAYWLAGAPEPEPEQVVRTYRLLVAGGNARAREVKAEAESFGLELDILPEVVKTALEPEKKPPALLPTLFSRPTSFIGRELELAELRNLLAQEDCSLVTVLGAGGAGKTRLALKFAQEALEHETFADGVYFADLMALADPELVPAAVAAALHGALPGKQPLAELSGLLRDKRALLVLDNFEHLVFAAGMLAEVLKHCPNLKLLVTSRERLNLSAEWVYGLEGLRYPKSPFIRGDVEQSVNWGDFDAVRLFVQRARRSRCDFDPQGHLLHILKICRLVDGSPLGIELAAAWVRVMTPEEIAAEIAHNLDLLQSVERDASERQQSIRASFEHSWKLLSEKEQEALRRFAAFRRSFTQEAARQVTGASFMVLSSLVDKVMLSRDTNGRYHRHPLIIQFMDEKARAHPEEAAAMLARHSAYYLSFLARQLEEGPQVLEVELDNLRDAWRFVVMKKDETALNNALPLLDRLYTLMGRYGEAEAVFALAAEGLEEGTLTWARVLARQGKHYPFLGQYKKSRALLETSLAVFRRYGSQQDTAFALRHLGFAAGCLTKVRNSRP
jgi:predicted ATPase